MSREFEPLARHGNRLAVAAHGLDPSGACLEDDSGDQVVAVTDLLECAIECSIEFGRILLYNNEGDTRIAS